MAFVSGCAAGSPQCQHRTNGRPSGSNGSAGTEVVNGSQDPSLPRVYEDPDEVAASNQVKRKQHKEIDSMQYLT